MNILHVMGMSVTKYGGIERFNVELTKQLIKNKHKVYFLYEDKPEPTHFIKDIENEGGKIVIMSSKKPILFSLFLIKFIRKYKIELVHAHFTKARFYSIPISYLMGIRELYFTIHSTMPPLKSMKIHTKLWYNLTLKISKVFAVSNHITNVCKENWGDKIDIYTAYLGVSKINGDRKLIRNNLLIDEDEKILLTVSNFNHIKGLDILCYSMKLLKNNNSLKNVRLFIVGQPEKDKVELSKLIEELDIADYVVLVGISNQVSDFLIASDIYIQASRYEGIGLALMEAASAKLPIVASNVGGIPEVVFDETNGYLVQGENPQELADRIELLLEDEEKRNILSENSFEVSKKFRIDNNVRNLILKYNL